MGLGLCSMCVTSVAALDELVPQRSRRRPSTSRFSLIQVPLTAGRCAADGHAPIAGSPYGQGGTKTPGASGLSTSTRDLLTPIDLNDRRVWRRRTGYPGLIGGVRRASPPHESEQVGRNS